MEFEYEYRREDENFRSTSLWRRLGSTSDFFRSRYALLAVLPFILAVGLVVTGYMTVQAAVLGWLLAFMWFWSRNLWSGMRIVADEASPIFGRKLCRIDEQGISIESAGMKSWHAWSTVRDVLENQKYISIYYDLIRAIVLPKKSFRSPEELAQFLALVRKYASVSKIGEMQSAPPADVPAGLRLRTIGLLVWIVLLLLVIVPLTNLLGSMNRFEPITDARVVVEKTEATKDSVVALGKVENPGKAEMRVSMLEMQFFDADGKFIDQCTDYTYGLSVKAGASENFKAVCALAATSEAGVPGTTIMPSTLKHFSKVEVKAKGAYLGASLFSLY